MRKPNIAAPYLLPKIIAHLNLSIETLLDNPLVLSQAPGCKYHKFGDGKLMKD